MKGYGFILLFAAGISPKTLIHLGFPRASVYRWYGNYRRSIKEVRKELEERISVPPR